MCNAGGKYLHTHVYMWRYVCMCMCIFEKNFDMSRGILSRRDRSSQDSTLISRVSWVERLRVEEWAKDMGKERGKEDEDEREM